MILSQHEDWARLLMLRTSWGWSLATGISALERLKQESHCEFEATMGYVVTIPEHPGVQSKTPLLKNQNSNSLHINQSSPGKNGGEYKCLSPNPVVMNSTDSGNS